MTADRLLRGAVVLNPRARHQAGALSERLRALGAEVVEAPTIRIVPGDSDALVDALGELAEGAFAAVCFTSPNGAAAVADVLDAVAGDPFGAAPLVAAIGPGTAAAMRDRLGLEPDLVPEDSTTAALAAAFPPGRGRVLLPRADIATETLAEGLRSKGYEPIDVDAYRTVAVDDFDPEVVGALAAGRIDVIAFASSSTVRSFLDVLGGRPWSARVASIGPVTTATCREHGIEPAAEADSHDLDGLVAAIVRAAAG